MTDKDAVVALQNSIGYSPLRARHRPLLAVVALQNSIGYSGGTGGGGGTGAVVALQNSIGYSPVGRYPPAAML